MNCVHPDDCERTVAADRRSLTAEVECKVEYRLQNAGGQYRHIICGGVPRFEASGFFLGYIASCFDLTDTKRAHEEAFERQNLESLGVLAGGIAHDFNNLLNNTLAYSELAEKADRGEVPYEEFRQIREVAIRGRRSSGS